MDRQKNVLIITDGRVRSNELKKLKNILSYHGFFSSVKNFQDEKENYPEDFPKKKKTTKIRGRRTKLKRKNSLRKIRNLIVREKGPPLERSNKKFSKNIRKKLDVEATVEIEPKSVMLPKSCFDFPKKSSKTIVFEFFVKNLSKESCFFFQIKTTNPMIFSVTPNKITLDKESKRKLFFEMNIRNLKKETVEKLPKDKFRIDFWKINGERRNTEEEKFSVYENSSTENFSVIIPCEFRREMDMPADYSLKETDTDKIIVSKNEVVDVDEKRILEGWKKRWKCQIFLNEKLVREIDDLKKKLLVLETEQEESKYSLFKEKENVLELRERLESVKKVHGGEVDARFLLDKNFFDKIELEKYKMSDLKRIYENLSATGKVVSSFYSKKIEREFLDLKDEKLCCVCMNNKKSVLVRPCNHICLCKRCCNAIQNTNNFCPLCRTQILSTVEGIKI